MKASEFVLILGGARAGKSAFALQLAKERIAAEPSRVCFIATAEARDEEMRARIKRHHAERPPAWQTVEEPLRLDRALEQSRGAAIVIIDCLTLFVSNWLLSELDYQSTERQLMQIVEAFLEISVASGQTVICVSNEVGLGLVPDSPIGRAFRDLLGRVNQEFARAAAQVYFLVAGLPMRLKP